MKNTIIFDFDGVIADSFELIYEIWKSNYPDLTKEEYCGIMNLPADDPLRLSFNNRKGTGILEDFSFQNEYSKKLKELRLTEIKRRALENLSKEYILHIISSVNTQTIKNFLDLNGVINCFNEVLGRDVEISKVKRFQMLFEKYNLNSEKVIFVTDTVGDMEEAKEVNIKNIVAVTDGFHKKEDLEKSNPKYIINSILNLKEVL